MKTKSVIVLAAMATTLFALTACSDDENNEPTPEPEPTSKVTANPYNGSVCGTLTKGERPTWTVVTGSSLTSMCLMMDEYGVPTTVDSTDMLAAFINNSCRGIAKPIYDSGEKYWRFNLAVICIEADNGVTSLPVELRYYSAVNQGSYTSETFPYSDGAIKGEYGKNKGFVPNWK